MFFVLAAGEMAQVALLLGCQTEMPIRTRTFYLEVL